MSIDPTGIMRGGIDACGWTRRHTCILDGDTGWQDGRKWRMTGVDAPEVCGAECARERELAGQSTARIIELMTSGYCIIWNGKDDRFARALVSSRSRCRRGSHGITSHSAIPDQHPLLRLARDLPPTTAVKCRVELLQYIYLSTPSR